MLIQNYEKDENFSFQMTLGFLAVGAAVTAATGGVAAPMVISTGVQVAGSVAAATGAATTATAGVATALTGAGVAAVTGSGVAGTVAGGALAGGMTAGAVEAGILNLIKYCTLNKDNKHLTRVCNISQIAASKSQ